MTNDHGDDEDEDGDDDDDEGDDEGDDDDGVDDNDENDVNYNVQVFSFYKSRACFSLLNHACIFLY